jgi:hypothetical protein
MKALVWPHRLKHRMQICKVRPQRRNRKIAEIVRPVASAARAVATVTTVVKAAAKTVAKAATVIVMNRPVKTTAPQRQQQRQRLKLR